MNAKIAKVVENAKSAKLHTKLRIQEVPKMQRLPFLQRIQRTARMKTKQRKEDSNIQSSGLQIDLH